MESALQARPGPARVLDLGTGTGCLLLSILAERPAAFGIGIDRSPAAAALAARNARALNLADRAAMLCADWAAPLSVSPPTGFDLVLSNPPYIPGPDIAALMPEVAAFEPRSALDGGPDGLDCYRHLLHILPGLLAPGGLAVFELGQGQAAAVTALAHQAGFATRLRADLGGIPRALLLEKRVGSTAVAD